MQHRKMYSDIFMLYGMIDIYEFFFCYNWQVLCCSNK